MCILLSEKNVTYEVSMKSGTCIIEALNFVQPDMNRLIVMAQLLPYLVKFVVVTFDEVQKLQLKYLTNSEKVQELSVMLVSKSPEGKKDFIKALYESSQNPGNSGHKKLITKLQQKGVMISELPVDTTNDLSSNFDDSLSTT